MRASRIILWSIIAILLIGLVGGAWWYASVPHTAEAQFALAEKLDKALRGDTRSVQELQPQIDQVVEQYHRVGTRFGPSPKAAEAIKRIAKVQEEVAKDDGKTLATLDELEKAYPDDDNAGFALLEQARLIRAQADVLKADKKPEADGKYKEALAKLDDYRRRFASGKLADAALMGIGHIWQDGLEEPLIHSIETFAQVLKDYPQSEYRPEAIYCLGKAYEKAKEPQRALQLYAQLLQDYPKSPWAPDALLRQGQIEASMMDHKKAAEDFAKLEQDYPDSPLRGTAGARANSERGEQAKDEGETYGKGRYGGTIPYDTIRDKPLPPAGMFKEFADQHLDAEQYDLNVDFLPAENRITVHGTLKLANRGDDKTELLLMLGRGLKISELTVDGAAAANKHSGESLRLTLPAPLKKDGETLIGFTYSGQYADTSDLPTASGPSEKSSTGPATSPASVPAPTMPAPSKYTLDAQMGLGKFGYALSGASWYPITIIGDVFKAHITLHTPANMEAVTNGAPIRREASTREGTPGVFEFQTQSPVFGLYFAYGPYVVQDKQVGDIHFYTYLRPANASKHDAYVEVTNRILSFYAEKFAPFPYEKMAIIETPLPPFLGGVGPASMMFLQQTMVDRKEVPENLLAHELAHQWFGNLIPINITDANYNQWMSEGFATYCDALYTEHTDGPKALSQHIQKYGQLFFQLAMAAPPGSGKIRDTLMQSPLYRPVVYEKGAIVLHMLRKVMGDDKFFQLMRQFVAKYRDKPTTMDDFRRMAAEIQGSDLSWFFSEWIDQAVFAHWTVNAEVTGGDKAGEEAKIKIAITQPDDLIKMPADITLIGAKGERLVLPNQMLDKKEQTLEASAPFRPVKIVVDEDYSVLRRPGSDNIWTAEKAITH